MKIAIIGQQDFGKAVLEAFLARGDTVAAVFCAPEKEGAKADPMRVAAQEKGLKVYQLPNLKGADAVQAMKDANADIGIMAFVLQFAPQEFVSIPKHGTIQYHPSLLPKYRGPSSINWPIAKGETKTGLTIFRPTDGLDEGAVILQKETPVSENDTLGTVYFDRLFPMGVQAMLEAADLVVAGKHKEVVQDESQASYEGWFRANECEGELEQPRGLHPQHHSRRRSGAGRVDHDRRQEAAALRLEEASRAHVRRGEGQGGRDRRYRRRIDAHHRAGRPDRGLQGEARGRQEGLGGRVGEVGGRGGGNTPRLLIRRSMP